MSTGVCVMYIILKLPLRKQKQTKKLVQNNQPNQVRSIGFKSEDLSDIQFPWMTFWVYNSLWHSFLWFSTVNITGTLFRNIIPLTEMLGSKKMAFHPSLGLSFWVFFLPWVLQWAHRSAWARFQFAPEVLFRGAFCSERPPPFSRSCFSFYISTLLKLISSLATLAKLTKLLLKLQTRAV